MSSANKGFEPITSEHESEMSPRTPIRVDLLIISY